MEIRALIVLFKVRLELKVHKELKVLKELKD
jgi:hypothetical protein